MFSVMFVTVGFSCFIWQSITTGIMFYRTRKPLVCLVFVQSILGIITTFVTLLVAFVNVNCTFRLYLSVICVNIGDMSLQFVLLWKAYLGNSRSKIMLYLGAIPIGSIAVFIFINLTIGKSNTHFEGGVCLTQYPTYTVVIKAAIDFVSNIFLSACFILVIYRHYRILGNILSGSSPVIYTIDWYLASYLIIRQLRHSKATQSNEEEDGEIDTTASHLYIKPRNDFEANPSIVPDSNTSYSHSF
ncbi:hypothetical protein BY458DRAFT_478248 [Sporodiniella umbellata]|nr:hypothetical protein BY458DRAFT_478248 [Sporodiniella umbellata]